MDEYIIIWINYFCILWFESPQPGSLNTHEFNLHNHNTGFPLYLQVSTRKYIVVIIYQKYRQHREQKFHCSKCSEVLNLFCSFTCFETILDVKLLDFFCYLFLIERRRRTEEPVSDCKTSQTGQGRENKKQTNLRDFTQGRFVWLKSPFQKGPPNLKQDTMKLMQNAISFMAHMGNYKVNIPYRK